VRVALVDERHDEQERARGQAQSVNWRHVEVSARGGQRLL
jgi:hypothetical protein